MASPVSHNQMVYPLYIFFYPMGENPVLNQPGLTPGWIMIPFWFFFFSTGGSSTKYDILWFTWYLDIISTK